jgi:signal transduction histidine kinase
MSAPPDDAPRSGLSRLTVMQWFVGAMVVLAVVAVTGTVVALLALKRNADARARVVDRVDPALVATLRLQSALLDQETAVRGYALTGNDVFLAPYRTGVPAARQALADLQRLADRSGGGQLRTDLARVRADADAWNSGYAAVVIDAIRRRDRRAVDADLDALGKARFDAVRGSLATLSRNLTAERVAARADLRSAARLVLIWVIVSGVLVLVAVLATTLGLRRIVVLPVTRLARGVRRVADGAFDRQIGVDGPREIADLGADTDAMRGRILDEVAALQAARDELELRALELQRSNAELEQFAYVASHDLQEPLRKVASFCQMLERRYGEQLDDRAREYIAFAVDGAKRMQDLINDLLAFSRVGRIGAAHGEVALGAVLTGVQRDLGAAIEETGAHVEVGALPTVQGDPTLLAVVFRNLIANAIKFRGDEPPRVVVSAARDGEMWDFTVSDNGIGIEPEYAERIFVIFQRLHTRDAYEGTGIGLALCRKIVEHHGGRIWLAAPANGAGATFRFTLPSQIDEEERTAA